MSHLRGESIQLTRASSLVMRLAFGDASSSSVHTPVLARNLQTASCSLEALVFRLPILLLPLQLFPTRLLCQTTSPSTLHRHANQAVNAIMNQSGVILFTNTICIPPQPRLSPNCTSISHGPFFTFVKLELYPCSAR